MLMPETEYTAIKVSHKPTSTHDRYHHFLLMLPVFFILPLALFSLQEWWQVWVQSSVTPSHLGLASFSDGVWAPHLTLAYAWSAFIQGVSWLGAVVLVVLGYLLKKGGLIRGGYLLFVCSFLLQWQLPQYFASLN